MADRMVRIPLEEKKAIRRVLARFRRDRPDEDVFYTMCFCLCSPQAPFAGNLQANRMLKRHRFHKRPIPASRLERMLRSVRFKKNKARILREARERFPDILRIVRADASSAWKRRALVRSVRGFGMKTASHFLRNTGHFDLAVIDRHILRFLGRKSVRNIREYERIEKLFKKIAAAHRVPPAVLDAYLWRTRADVEWEEFVH